MFIIISPAKRIDENAKMFHEHTLARNPGRTQELIQELNKYSAQDLQDLMHINPQLADLNFGRYQQFKKRHNRQNSLQALFAFNGDVFLGLQAKNFDNEELSFAQDHLRILSGLYGLLRPLDLIQAYRLEMGSKLKFSSYKNLYEFWGDSLTRLIKSDMRATGSKVLLNLASNEYFKAIKPEKFKSRIITATFKEYREGKLKFYSVFGKKARGLMTKYVIENKINNPDDLKGFDVENYYFDEKLSSEFEFVFVR